MKTTIFISLLLLTLASSTSFAEEVEQVQEQRIKLYFGLDIFKGETKYDTSFSGVRPVGVQGGDIDLDQDGFRLKFGAKLDEGWRIQGYFQNEDTQDLSNNIFALGVDVIKGFEIANNFELFVLGGLSVHWRELDEPAGVIYTEDYLSGSGIKLGTGAIYKLNETFELIGGFDWQYRAWQDIDVVQIDQSTVYYYRLRQDDVSKTFYLGINGHF